MSRRSSRIATRPAESLNALTSESSGNNDNESTEDRLVNGGEQEESTSRRSKRQKPKTKRTQTGIDVAQKMKNIKGKRGKLKQLPYVERFPVTIQ